ALLPLDFSAFACPPINGTRESQQYRPSLCTICVRSDLVEVSLLYFTSQERPGVGQSGRTPTSRFPYTQHYLLPVPDCGGEGWPSLQTQKYKLKLHQTENPMPRPEVSQLENARRKPIHFRPGV